MTHHENLKIIAFISDNPTSVALVIEILTAKGYPKVNREDMKSQIEHLVNAGQHRLVTGDIQDSDTLHSIKHEFPGAITLVGIGPAEAGKYKGFTELTDDQIESTDSDTLNELLERLDFLA